MNQRSIDIAILTGVACCTVLAIYVILTDTGVWGWTDLIGALGFAVAAAMIAGRSMERLLSDL